MQNSRATDNILRDGYHTISIRDDLPKIPKDYPEELVQISPPNDFWMDKFQTFLSSYQSTHVENYQIQYSIINGPYTSTCLDHPILTAFLRAYNSHEGLVLSPDDIWLMICIYFSSYVNQNPTSFEDFYNDKQKEKLLAIENEDTFDSDWEYFLEQIRCQMTSHIKTDLCHLLTTKFSTTTKVESLLSSLTIMSAFKKTVHHQYRTNSCGIRNVHFMGNFNDWILLKEKVEQFKLWTNENDEFHAYIHGILPVLDEFIQTYQGNVNNQFWDTVFDLEHTKDGSNQSEGLYTNGWFLRLCYGNHTENKCLMSHITLNSLRVPVIVENEHTNTLKTSYLLGGFHGVLSQNEKHKPVMSLMVMGDANSLKDFEDVLTI